VPLLLLLPLLVLLVPLLVLPGVLMRCEGSSRVWRGTSILATGRPRALRVGDGWVDGWV